MKKMNDFILCGECGLFGMHDEHSDNQGNCRRCGADHWLEWGDFDNPDLIQYVRDIAGIFVMDVQELKDHFEMKARLYAGDKALATLKEFDEYLTVNDGQNIIRGGSIYHDRIKRILEYAKN